MSIRPGARVFFQSRSAAGWQNPYVMDGLLAMWDGIWNIGGGVEHDSNSLVWWDCLNGYPICSNWSGTEFSTDGLLLGSNNAAGLFGGIYGSKTLSDYGFRSIEVVFGVGVSQNSVVIAVGGRSVTIKTAVSGVGFFRNGSYMTRAGLDMSTPTKIYTYGEYESTSSQNASTVIIDGQATTAVGSDSWGNNDGVGYGRIKCGYNTPNQYVFTGNIHAIRLYSRALTAAEIAANYAVDKERFNLP